MDQALVQSPDKRGDALLGLAEDQWFDRKSARAKPWKLAEALVGFANAEGGAVVVGSTTTAPLPNAVEVHVVCRNRSWGSPFTRSRHQRSEWLPSSPGGQIIDGVGSGISTVRQRWRGLNRGNPALCP